MGYIYQIRNRITGKSYIGETIKEPEVRWKQHIACAKTGKGCPALRDAFKKYGIESFEFKVLIICFDNDVYRHEIEYINKYDTLLPNGYNILPGKQYINNISDRNTKLLDINLSGRIKNPEKWNEIVKNSKIYPKYISKPKELKERISESLKRYYLNNPDHNFNIDIKKHQDVMCKSVGRPIGQYNDSYILLKEYKSISDAGRNSGVKKTNIQQVLKGNNKRAGGFIWKYLNNRA